jgi:hypothetical protein
MQVGPYVRNVSEKPELRRLAIEIASACELQPLQDDLASIILDMTQALDLRIAAGYALDQIGDRPTKKKLTPLAIRADGDDHEDQLKGVALRAVWPEHLSLHELFTSLTPPKREHFLGAYSYFILYELAANLPPKDIPATLKLAAGKDFRASLPSQCDDIEDSIVIQAMKHIGIPGVLEALALTLILHLKNPGDIVGTLNESQFRRLIADDYTRRKILGALFPNLSSSAVALKKLWWTRNPLILVGDIPWLVQYTLHAPSNETASTLAFLARNVFEAYYSAEPRSSEHIEVILAACAEDTVFSRAFASLIMPVNIRGPQARWLKDQYQEQYGGKKSELLQPSPKARISNQLNLCESGDSGAWAQLTKELVLTPYDKLYDTDLLFEPDLTTLPGWDGADELTHSRITRAAERYVTEQTPDPRKWLGVTLPSDTALAGVKALALLVNLNRIATVERRIWKKWAPAVVAYPVFGELRESRERIHQELVKIAYESAPNEAMESLTALIEKDDRDKIYSFPVLRKFRDSWDDRVSQAILLKAQDVDLTPEGMGYLLDTLLDHKCEQATHFILSFISSSARRIPFRGKNRLRAIYATSALFAHTEDPLWVTAWSIMKQLPKFSDQVLSTLASKYRLDTLKLDQLEEYQVAELCELLLRRYPQSSDPPFEGGARYLTPRDNIGSFRNSALRHLAQRGTQEALAAVQGLVSAFPSESSLPPLLEESISQTNSRTQILRSPREIIELAGLKDRRLVDNGEQLLNVLLESLERLNKDLHGETPSIVFLWNQQINKDEFWPKTEEDYSDWIKRYLNQDLKERGVIALREVVIRRGMGQGKKGQRTDIYVNARKRGRRNDMPDSLTAIIEVKGSWHKERRTAMKTQLVDRYLKDNTSQHGIYVLCYPYCTLWSDADGRKQRALKSGIPKAQTTYSQLAQDLSDHDLLIKAFVLDTTIHLDEVKRANKT